MQFKANFFFSVKIACAQRKKLKTRHQVSARLGYLYSIEKKNKLGAKDFKTFLVSVHGMYDYVIKFGKEMHSKVARFRKLHSQTL